MAPTVQIFDKRISVISNKDSNDNFKPVLRTDGSDIS